MEFTPRELLARLIKCEAGGEGDTGMQAVATVVMNRVNVPDGEYLRIGQGDLRNIIFQTGQFDCASDTFRGAPNPQSIYTNPPEPIHYEIADWAIGGGRLNQVDNSLWYFNPFNALCGYTFPSEVGVFHTRINLHCFFRPTALYSET